MGEKCYRTDQLSDTNVSISLTDGVPEDATLSADTIAQESVLESRPELKEELPGLLSIYDISVRQNGETLEIKDNPMTVKIPLNDHLKGYKYYQAVYLGDPLERFDAVVEGIWATHWNALTRWWKETSSCLKPTI